MNKRILVVGAGKGQLPVIHTAKSMGIEVFGVDKSSTAPGISILDDFRRIDVVDKEEIFNYAMEMKVDGVLTYQSDIGVPAVGYVSDKLKLNNVSENVAEIASNKILSRQAFLEQNINQPKFAVVSSLQQTQKQCELFGYPCIVKAADSSGSRGVTKVNCQQDVSRAFEAAFGVTRLDKILVEEFIHGYEIGAQTFSVAGKQTLVLLHNDTFNVKDCLVPTGHSMPISGLSERIQEKIQNEVRAAVSALGILNGPANVDLIIRNNKAYIIEIGARAGATCLPELVKWYTGINWEEASILSALGQKPNIDLKLAKPIAVSILYSESAGIYRGYDFDQSLLKKLNVLDFELEIENEEFINSLTKGTDRIGKVICSGNSPENAEENIKEFIKNLNFYLDT
jgi:biotin carboxylase